MNPKILTFFSVIRVVATISSVALYLVVHLYARKAFTKISADMKDARVYAQFVRRQRQLTATMGLQCVLTLILHITPIALIQYSFEDTDIADAVNLYSTISPNISLLAACGLFFWRQKDIANAVRSLLHRLFT
ncbi:hypothetical protein AB6A40_000927 [Gnathostoma spinigerum]|uniref:G protein-coupled receptor n=1 Tax=Gnathostoma spinigerum TaxID=75299 RepID=A0ABD6EBQ2_9BILA